MSKPTKALIIFCPICSQAQAHKHIYRHKHKKLNQDPKIVASDPKSMTSDPKSMASSSKSMLLGSQKHNITKRKKKRKNKP